ncbi:hypothetical protein BHE74_00012735 [Ensete ventricosum]|nr:hypothetical protein BHE74_00012735 [Ensete ventricosum]
MKKRTSLGLVALFTAVTLLLTVDLQFEHLKVLPPRIHHPFLPPTAFLCFASSSNADVGGGVSLFLPSWMCGSTNLSCLRRYMLLIPLQETSESYSALLAMAVGILQKENVDSTVRKVCIQHRIWVEGMAPVFSRAAWQCVWHLIQNYLFLQNDLVHGWGLDMKLGYCAQGDRTEKVGVIDSEFIVHMGIPSLGGSSINKVLNLPPGYCLFLLPVHMLQHANLIPAGIKS